MNQKDMNRNVSLYKWYVLFNEPLFWGPVLIISLQKLGHMTLSDIYFMESAVVIICVLLDIPSGTLADIIGKRTMLIFGRILLFISICLFAGMSSPLLAWTANIAWAIGYSFQSGADVSLLYSSLKNGGHHTQFKKVEGRAVGSRFLLMACCALIVSALVTIHPRLPLIFSIIPMGIPLIISFRFKESTQTKKYSASEQIRILKAGVFCALRNKHIRWIIGFSAFIAGTSKIWFFTYNPYFERVGIHIAYYGFIFFLINIVAWVSSRYAHQMANLTTERNSILWMIACIAIPILLMGLFPFWPLAYLILFQNLVRGFMSPFLGDFINKHIDTEEIRATVLSVRSSTTNTVSIFALAWFGFMTGQFSLLSSLSILGIIALGIGALSIQRYQKLFLTPEK